MTQKWINKINQYFDKHGLTGRSIDISNIHIVDADKLEKFLEYKGAAYYPYSETVLIARPKDGIYGDSFLNFLVHEILHAKSYQLFEIRENEGVADTFSLKNGLKEFDLLSADYKLGWLNEAMIDWTMVDIL